MKFTDACLAGLLAATALCASSSARATGAEEDSKALFAQGRELRLAGKCAEAIIAFRRALELYPTGLGALRNVAECEEELHLYAASRRDWWDLRRAAMQSNEARYASWDKDAEEHYRRLESKVGRLTVQLQGADASKIRMTLDGVPFDGRLLGVELERDPGTHVLEAFYGGAAPVHESVVLSEGARETVKLSIPGGPQPAGPERGAPVGGPPGDQAAPAQPSGTARTAGFVLLGVGAAGAVATAISVGIRQGALGSLEDACPTYETTPCPSSVEGDVSTGETASTLANVFGAVAIAGVGAGVILLVTSPSTSSPAAPASTAAKPTAKIVVVPTLAGAAAHLQVRF